jgi:hypothetical protein
VLRQRKRLKRAQDPLLVNGFELACHRYFILSTGSVLGAGQSSRSLCHPAGSEPDETTRSSAVSRSRPPSDTSDA